jgi:ABC-2 type transport system ATP-binding protein
MFFKVELLKLLMYLLEFNDVVKKYGKKGVLNGVTFKIKEKEIFGLIGKSGSGKSTFLKVLMGMTKIEGGEILFDKKDAKKYIQYLRGNTGFATQGNMLFDELTTRENAYYFGDLYEMKKKVVREEFDKLISLLSLDGFENTLVKNLSGGMQKRANLLVSLIHQPKLLILDEPTVGLDTLLRNSLWEYIHKINDAGTTILVTSHLLEEIEQNCDRIGILEQGKIWGVATPAQYKKKFGKKKTLNEIFHEVLSV